MSLKLFFKRIWEPKKDTGTCQSIRISGEFVNMQILGP